MTGPGVEAFDLLLDDRQGGGDLLAACLQVSRETLLQRVEIVQLTPRQVAHLRLHIPRNGDVDEDAPPRGATGDGATDEVAAHDGVRRAGRANDGVGPGDGVRKLVPPERRRVAVP